eukprot:Selendium_serpulae@DN5109_c0_g1_i1.p1
MIIACSLSTKTGSWFLCSFLVFAYLFKNTHAQIYIDDPPHLVRFIQGSTAAFGTPFYGEHIIGQLFYGQSESNDKPHCQNDYKPLPAESTDASDSTYAEAPLPGPLKRIIVVRRGGCHFAQKVQTAQKEHNADAVIVVDNNPERTSSDVRLIIMAEDDGHKRQVDIPSVLISFEEGEQLINGILGGDDVFARLEWDVPNAPTVEIDQWVSPALISSVKFLQKFAPYARRFGTHVDFRPHYWIFELAKDYKTMCTDSSGKFCSIDAEWGNSTTGRSITTGKTVVQESVRQKCLWLESRGGHLGEQFPAAYWNYVEKQPLRCPVNHSPDSDPALFFGEECSYQLMKDIGAPLAAVTKCYENEMEEILTEERSTVAWSPTATMINNWRYAGPLTPSTVATAACTGFFEEPAICEELQKDTFLAEPEKENGFVPLAWWIYLLTVIGVVLASLGIIVACYRGYLYRRLRNELRYEVFEEVKNRTKGNRSEGDVSNFQEGNPEANQHNMTAKPFDGVSIATSA